MAALYRFPNYSSRSSQNLCSCRFSLELVDNQQQEQLVRQNHRFPPCKILVSASSSSSKNSRITTQAKAGKSVKSNADLCAELQEFLSIVGLPEGHVPSLKELREHGRNDLANVVRRRGYRLITELLSNSIETDTSTEISSAEKQRATDSCENESVEGEGQEVSESAEGQFLLNDDTKADTPFCSENGVPLVASSGTHEFTESGPCLSLLEKTSKFIKEGEWDNIEVGEDELNIGEGTFNTGSTDEEVELGSSVGKKSSEVLGHFDTLVRDSSHSASELVLPPETHSGDISPVQNFHDVPSQKDLDIQTSVRDNQHEINHLKAMLHQKELELSKLKEQIENEKLALSTLQAQAEKEIIKAQKIMSSKDEEFHTVEESLCGLKEVQIEYWGNGDTVEIAGSFNGWHHKIRMDSHPLSMSVRPKELRNSRLWSTVLWLYPGVYEIKFVIDGNWMIDPKRESIGRGSIHNNILRVDR